MTANSELPKYIERLERMDEEISELKDDRKDILAEAKSKGYNPKAITKLITERRKKEKNADKWKADNDDFDVFANAMKLFE